MRVPAFCGVLDAWSCKKYIFHLNLTFNCITRSYNKQESDFHSRSEYDDYLEEREDISEYERYVEHFRTYKRRYPCVKPCSVQYTIWWREKMWKRWKKG